MNKTERYAVIFLLSTLAAGLLFFSLSKYHFYQKYLDVDNTYVDNVSVIDKSRGENTEQNLISDGKGTYGENRSHNQIKQIDINNANLEELMELPGIGREIALRIIEYRVTHGPFKEVRELIEVKGIGEKKLAMLKEYIMIK